MSSRKNLNESESLKDDILTNENDNLKKTHICLIFKKKD